MFLFRVVWTDDDQGNDRMWLIVLCQKMNCLYISLRSDIFRRYFPEIMFAHLSHCLSVCESLRWSLFRGGVVSYPHPAECWWVKRQLHPSRLEQLPSGVRKVWPQLQLLDRTGILGKSDIRWKLFIACRCAGSQYESMVLGRVQLFYRPGNQLPLPPGHLWKVVTLGMPCITTVVSLSLPLITVSTANVRRITAEGFGTTRMFATDLALTCPLNTISIGPILTAICTTIPSSRRVECGYSVPIRPRLRPWNFSRPHRLIEIV